MMAAELRKARDTLRAEGVNAWADATPAWMTTTLEFLERRMKVREHQERVADDLAQAMFQLIWPNKNWLAADISDQHKFRDAARRLITDGWDNKR